MPTKAHPPSKYNNHRMIKYFLIIITLFIVACDNSNTAKLTVSTSYDNEKDTTIVFPCFEKFTSITSIGNVDIEYKQGEYNIEAFGNANVIEMLDISFDSGVLTVGMLNETKVELSPIKNKQKITLYVSSPELKFLSLCGNGNFTSKKNIKAELFHCGIFSSGTIKIDSLECGDFKFENNDVGSATLKHVVCNNAAISTYGTTKTDVQLYTSNDIYIHNGGNSTIQVYAKSTNVDLSLNNNANGKYDVDCSTLNVNSWDKSSLSIKGIYKNKNIRKSHESILTLL